MTRKIQKIKVWGSRLSTITSKSLSLITVILFAIMAAFYFQHWLPLSGDSTFAEVTTRNGYMLIIKTPNTEQQEQIIVFTKDPLMHPLLAVRSINSGTGNIKQEITLSNTDWESINSLRGKWCIDKPRFAISENTLAVYNVGFRCNSKSGLYAEHLQIPVNDIPTELNHLFAIFNQPIP